MQHKYTEKIFPFILTRANKEILKNSSRCVCIYCGVRFKVSKIKRWLKLDKISTAICPYCSLSDIIPETYDGATITDEELNYLRNSYYAD